MPRRQSAVVVELVDVVDFVGAVGYAGAVDFVDAVDFADVVGAAGVVVAVARSIAVVVVGSSVVAVRESMFWVRYFEIDSNLVEKLNHLI